MMMTVAGQLLMESMMSMTYQSSTVVQKWLGSHQRRVAARVQAQPMLSI
jgi:hypothetical protein